MKCFSFQRVIKIFSFGRRANFIPVILYCLVHEASINMLISMKKEKVYTLIILNVIFLDLMVHFYRTNHCVHMLFTQKNIRTKNEIRNLYVFEN